VKRELFERRLRVEIDVVGPGLVHLLEMVFAHSRKPRGACRGAAQQVFRNNRCKRIVVVCELRNTYNLAFPFLSPFLL